jgi:hypothetical protein
LFADSTTRAALRPTHLFSLRLPIKCAQDMPRSDPFFADGLYDIADDHDREVADFRELVCEMRSTIDATSES